MYVTVLSVSSIGLNSRIRVLSDPRAVNDEIKVRWAVARPDGEGKFSRYHTFSVMMEHTTHARNFKGNPLSRWEDLHVAELLTLDQSPFSAL